MTTAETLKADAREKAVCAVFDELCLLASEEGLMKLIPPVQAQAWAGRIVEALLRNEAAWACTTLTDADATVIMPYQDRREALAAHAHVVWARWMSWQAKHARLIPQVMLHQDAVLHKKQSDAIERWERQQETPYAELTEAERASDRAIADEYLAIMKGSVESP